jgi:hypothetical protein
MGGIPFLIGECSGNNPPIEQPLCTRATLIGPHHEANMERY